MATVICLHGKRISKGCVEGEALVTDEPMSFTPQLFDVKTGTCTYHGRKLEGQSVKGKIVVYDTEIASTGGTWGLLNAVRVYGTGPKGIIVRKLHSITTSVIYAGIPAMHDIKEGNPCHLIKTGDRVKLDADNGVIEISRKSG